MQQASSFCGIFNALYGGSFYQLEELAAAFISSLPGLAGASHVPTRTEFVVATRSTSDLVAALPDTFRAVDLTNRAAPFTESTEPKQWGCHLETQ